MRDTDGPIKPVFTGPSESNDYRRNMAESLFCPRLNWVEDVPPSQQVPFRATPKLAQTSEASCFYRSTFLLHCKDRSLQRKSQSWIAFSMTLHKYEKSNDVCRPGANHSRPIKIRNHRSVDPTRSRLNSPPPLATRRPRWSDQQGCGTGGFGENLRSHGFVADGWRRAVDFFMDI
jgi:hypothetical protein